MIALIIPVVFILFVMVIALGISFVCVEFVLRLIGKGLAPQTARVVRADQTRAETTNRPMTGPLRSAAVQ
jgi:ABC-type dipeptide/oligopeptide/nickel transport system permease subunit